MARKLIVEIIGDSSSLEKSFKKTAVGANKFEKSIGQTVRGTAAASGAFRSFGRSLAFASGGFLAAASFTELLRGSIEQAGQAAAAQKQLAAQFRAAGQDLGAYQSQIDATIHRLSALAGIEDDEVKQSFTLAFRATQDVSQGLRITSIAADVARARNISLAQATLALNKAYGGNVGALRRLGITIPKTLIGMRALSFVSSRFAGQAQAGTTSQERFTAAFKNFEEIIGTAILPSFNKLLDKGARWLNNTDNQRKVQHAANKTVSTGAKILGFLGDSIGLVNQGLGPLAHDTKVYTENTIKAAKATHDFTNSLVFQAKALKQNDFNIAGTTGGGGDFTTQTVRPFRESGTPGASIAPSARTGLAAQFRRSQLALARALTTATQADERRVLEQQAKIIRAALNLTTNLKKRTTLYKELADVQNQIAGIDQKAQDAADQHAQKLKDARDKALAAAKARADKQKAQDAKELALLHGREDRLKTQIKAIQGRFKDQLDAARQGIGDLFAGPVKADASEIARRTLGLTTAPTGIGALTANLRAQTSQAAQFQKDINRLVKRGAPNELIKELRAAGVAGAGTQAHTLATATGPALKAFLTEFGKREKLALTTTQTIMRSQTVTLTADKVKLEGLKQDIHNHVTVELDGRKIAAETHKWQVRAQKRTAAQTSGRVAGFGPVVG